MTSQFHLRTAVLVSLSALLAACGGGEADTTNRTAHRFAAGIAALDAVPPGGAAPASSRKRALSDTGVVGAKEAFDWAEHTFPDLFGKPRQDMVVQHEGVFYTVAAYGNGNFLGLTQSGEIWGHGPFTGGALTRVGALADFADRIEADRAAVYPPAPALDLSRYALHTSSAPARYGSDAEGLARAGAMNHFNAVRLAAGAGAFNQVATIDAAAQSHSAYLKTNANHSSTRGLGAHNESPTLPGFTGRLPHDRMRAHGYPWVTQGEVISAGQLRRPTYCAESLLNTVYHMRNVMGVARDVGVGIFAGGADAGSCVVNFGSRNPQLPPAGTVVAYPFHGQTGVRFLFSNLNEVPVPFKSVTWAVGQPILASMQNLSAIVGTVPADLSVSEFSLRDDRGLVVPSFVVGHSSVKFAVELERVDDSSNDGYHAPMAVFLVPKLPLDFDTTYHVNFRGSYRGIPHAKSWSFRSEPSPFRLQTGPVVPSYPATEEGRRAAEFLNHLNAIRSAAGAGVLVQDPDTDARAQAFVDCIVANNQSVIGCNRFGSSYGGANTNAEQLLASILSRFFEIDRLLGGGRQFGGVVMRRPNSNLWDYTVAVVNYIGEYQYPDPGRVVSYPYPGQADVGLQAAPVASFPGNAGQPIMAMMSYVSAFKCQESSASNRLSSFALRNASGQQVPTYLLAHRDDVVTQASDRLHSGRGQGIFFLLPKSPLQPKTTYSVEFRGSTCGIPHDQAWSVSTGV